MKLKFRPHFEQLDARDLPSGTPIDPPPFTYDPAQLDTMLTDGELTTAELETLLGVDLDGSDSPNPADPQPAPLPGQPAPLPPVVKPPFTPVPPLTDPRVLLFPPPNLDFSKVQGGIAGNAAEIVEASNLKQQLGAIDIGLERIRDQAGLLVHRRADLMTLEQSLKNKVADLTVVAAQAQATLDNYTGQDQGELGRRLAARNTASQNLLNAWALLAEVTRLVENSLARGQYLTDKAAEITAVQTAIQGRLDRMKLNLLAGNRAGAPLQYTLPTFPIDWNTADWRDVTKPLTALQATVPAM